MSANINNASAADGSVDDIYYEHAMSLPLAKRLTLHARRKMFDHFMAAVQPDANTKILDFGASETETEEANVLEKSYPFPRQITCAGLGDGAQITAAYADVNYVTIQPGHALPFEDKSFDVAYSNAVFEHIGDPDDRQFILGELSRIARQVYITIPNRWFPVEHHTAIPFLHFHPAAFRKVTRMGKLKYWSSEEALQFLGRHDLTRLFEAADLEVDSEYVGLNLGLFSSNIAAWTPRP